MAHSDQQLDPGTQESLAPEMTELLLELSAGVHRHAMYPPGHPSLLNVADGVHERLKKVLDARAAVTVAVAHDQLIVEGGASDPDHPVLSELARRLHDHQLGAMSFDKGVTLPQLEDLLERLANDVERGYEPLGLLDEKIPSWAHIRLFPVGYDQLKIRGGAAGPEDEAGEPGERPPNPATELWLTLAKSALATDEIGMADADPLKLAEKLEAHVDDEFEENVMGNLLQLTEMLQHRPDDEAAEVRDQVSELIGALDPETLERLLEMGGDFDQRRKFVLDASQSLALDSVMKLLESAAQASGQNISTLLVRLLKKLARHADGSTGPAKAQAEEELRNNVEELIDTWNLEDPNPDQYTSVLDAMASSAGALSEGGGQEITGSLRVLQMALEVDGWGTTVEGALHQLYGDRQISDLLDLVESTDEDNGVGRRIDEILTNPRRYHQLLIEEALDEETLTRLSDRQTDPVEPLLEVLADADSRELRRRVFDQLTRLGDSADEAIMRHLQDERWFVQRNLLVLIQRLDPWPEGFDPEPYLSNPDARVRREAFTLAAGSEELRTRALTLGLSDEDERLAQMAVMEVRKGAPPAIIPTILNRIVRNENRPTQLRAAAIRVLRGAPLPMARDALIEVCLGGRGFLGRKALAPRSPELLAALGVLAHSWARDAKAKKVLSTARKSKDPEIQKAASPSRGAA